MFHQGAQQPCFEWTITMNGDDQALTTIGHCKDVVASVNSSQLPAVLRQNPCELAPGDLFHTATSMT
jgi:hypothetical protein